MSDDDPDGPEALWLPVEFTILDQNGDEITVRPEVISSGGVVGWFNAEGELVMVPFQGTEIPERPDWAVDAWPVQEHRQGERRCRIVVTASFMCG